METVIGSEVERVKWVDILKGLGILSVVWGHSGSKNAFYMFWFHMPLFFLVSGYLYRFKPSQTWLDYVQRKVKHLLVPYLFYLLLLTILMVCVDIWRGQPAVQFLKENWKALLLGGSLLEGVYATFWFTTCLFVTQISFDFLCRKVSSSLYKGLLVIGCFFLAYWESRYRPGVFVLWNADVSLYAIVFYALGHLIKQKKLLEKPDRSVVFGSLSLVLFLGFIYLYSHQILDYGLDMKHRQYYYFGSNILIPLVLTIFLCILSIILSKVAFLNKALVSLGKKAMVIMYLHLTAVYLARQIFAITPIRFFVVGLLGPLLFYQLVQFFPYGNFLALGETKKVDLTQFSKIPTERMNKTTVQ